ncbi:MAG: hypothetical protein IJO45_07020 [Oscillospiraceae bacterium]|nr:hypothetical protein [Oscillospiraceae bacterium]
MSDAIIVALITGGISLFGSVLAIISTSRKQTAELDKAMAVMKSEMSSMKEDIKSHNRYAQMFSENIPAIKTHMEDVDRRLNNLERSKA